MRSRIALDANALRCDSGISALMSRQFSTLYLWGQRIRFTFDRTHSFHEGVHLLHQLLGVLLPIVFAILHGEFQPHHLTLELINLKIEAARVAIMVLLWLTRPVMGL